MRHTHRQRCHARTLASAALGCLFLASPTIAQGDLEYEPGEGYHEEKWYDPSDWFNDDDAISYEDDSWFDTDATYDYDSSYGAIDQTSYAANYGYADGYNYDAYWDGYYDGYYDGYGDDEFGFDNWETIWTPGYQSAYSDGYYDGYYDQVWGYESNPYWYIIDADTEIESGSASDDQRRSEDETRKRGDRAQKKSKSPDGRNSGQRSAGASRASDESGRRRVERSRSDDMARSKERMHDMARERGTVERMMRVDKNAPDGHIVLRVHFEEGDPVVADFGPHMTRNDMPIAKGEMVTLCGKERQRNGRDVLVVRRIVDDGKTYRISGRSSSKSSKDGKSMNRGRSSRSSGSQSREGS